MKKTLSLKSQGRQPKPQPKSVGALEKHLKETLESILANEEQNQTGTPVVRLKSSEGTYNPNQERIILIRRNPFANNSEYQRAITQVNYRSLKQFCMAGIGHLYPDSCRESAELNLLDAVHSSMRAKYKDARNLYFKHLDAVAKLNDEVAYEYTPNDPEYQRAQWDADQSEIELNKVAAVESMDRYQTLSAELSEGNIITKKGRQLVLQAMMLAMCDALPSREKVDLPEKLRHDLRTAVTEKNVVDLNQYENLVKLQDLGKCSMAKGINIVIQDCARQLINASDEPEESTL